MVKFYLSVFKTLMSFLKENANPQELAHGIACGLMLGFVPKSNLLWYCIFFVLIFLRINKSAFVVCIAAGAFLSLFLDPLFDIVGYAILTIPAIKPAMQVLFNIPFFAFTKINNSIVLGSFVFSVLFYIPIYCIALKSVMLWEKHMLPKILNSKLAQVLHLTGTTNE